MIYKNKVPVYNIGCRSCPEKRIGMKNTDNIWIIKFAIEKDGERLRVSKYDLENSELFEKVKE